MACGESTNNLNDLRWEFLKMYCTVFFSFRMATVTLELEIPSPCNYILGSYAKRRNEINALEWSDNLPVYPKVGCVAQLKTFWSGLSLTRLSAFTLPFCQTIISEKVTLKVWPKKLFWKICMFQQFFSNTHKYTNFGVKSFCLRDELTSISARSKN